MIWWLSFNGRMLGCDPGNTGSNPVSHPMKDRVIVTQDNATIIICDNYPNCDRCEARFHCYTTGTKFKHRYDFSMKEELCRRDLYADNVEK